LGDRGIRSAGDLGAKEASPAVDTKKKELIGEFKNPGSDYGPKGKPIEVDAHDFENKERGQGGALRGL
jgi:hypothetical protein